MKKKCHVMLYGDNRNDHGVNMDQDLIIESAEEQLLGVTLDKKISSEIHDKNVHQGKPKTTRPCKNIPFYGLKEAFNGNDSLHNIIATALSYGYLRAAKLINKIHE